LNQRGNWLRSGRKHRQPAVEASVTIYLGNWPLVTFAKVSSSLAGKNLAIF
jgi:hypothetical protein